MLLVLSTQKIKPVSLRNPFTSTRCVGDSTALLEDQPNAYFFASSTSLWRKIFLSHKGSQNFGELIVMFLGTFKAAVNTQASNWPHPSPYWQTPLLLLFKLTSKSDLKCGFFPSGGQQQTLKVRKGRSQWRCDSFLVRPFQLLIITTSWFTELKPSLS